MAVEQRAEPLAPGTTAPDFALQSTPDQKVSLYSVGVNAGADGILRALESLAS